MNGATAIGAGVGRVASAARPYPAPLVSPLISLNQVGSRYRDTETYSADVSLFDRLVRVKDARPPHVIANRNRVWGKRGEIYGMSQASRVRLIRFMATIGRLDPSWFVTLTYREWVDDWGTWKVHLDYFLKAFRYEYDAGCGVWRLEFQDRGAPHFHLLLWLGRVAEHAALRVWAKQQWMSITGDRSMAARLHAAEVAPVTDMRNCGFYMSLYAAKDDQDRRDIKTGREWGLVRRELLQTEPVKKVRLDVLRVRLLRRLVRKAYQARNRSTYRRSRYWKSLLAEGRNFSTTWTAAESARVVSWIETKFDAQFWPEECVA